MEKVSERITDWLTQRQVNMGALENLEENDSRKPLSGTTLNEQRKQKYLIKASNIGLGATIPHKQSV